MMAELTNTNPGFIIAQRIDNSIYDSIELSIPNQCLELNGMYYHVILGSEKTRYKLLKNIKPYKNEDIFNNLQHNTICVWVIFSLFDKHSDTYVTSHIYALPSSIHEIVSKHFHLVYKIYGEFNKDYNIDVNYAGELRVMNSGHNNTPHISYNIISGSYMRDEVTGKTKDDMNLLYSQINNFMERKINRNIEYVLLADTIITPQYMALTNEYLQQLLNDGFTLLRFNNYENCKLYKTNKVELDLFEARRKMRLDMAQRTHERFGNGTPFNKNSFIRDYNIQYGLDKLNIGDPGEIVTMNMLRLNTNTRRRQQTRKRKLSNSNSLKKTNLNTTRKNTK